MIVQTSKSVERLPASTNHIHYHRGDLFKAPNTYIGHGVNCCGVMGSGIAKAFRALYEKEVYDPYKELCDRNRGVSHYIGGSAQILPLNKEETRFAVNLFTQYYPGANAKLDLIAGALDDFISNVRSHPERYPYKPLAIPAIGAGIGGLRWEDVANVLERVAKDAPPFCDESTGGNCRPYYFDVYFL